MHKFFLENNQNRKQLIDKFADSRSKILDSENEQIDYLKYLLSKNGTTFYVENKFDIKEFFASLKSFFEQKNKITLEEFNILDIKVFDIKNEQKIPKFLGLTKPISLVFYKTGNSLTYLFLESEWFNNRVVDPKIEKSNLLSELFIDNIQKFILEYIESTIEKELFKYASQDSFFIDNFNLRYQQFFLAERSENEILLAWLSVGAVKNLGLNKDFYKKLKWFYVLSNYESFLIGFNKYGDVLEAFDFQDRKISFKKGIRNSVVVDNYEWLPTINNGNKYKIISKATTLSAEQRTNYFARMNFINSPKNKDLTKFLIQESGLVTSDLTLFFVDYSNNPEKTIEIYSENDKILDVLSKILKHPQSEESLVFWFNDWKPSVDQSVFIMKMFVEIAQNKEELKKLLPLHKIIHDFLIKKDKDKYNKILYDIEYSRHLIVVEKFKEAESILKKDLKKLPDLTLTELLPAENIDPTGILSGQFLKVIILDLLSKTQKEKNSMDFIRKAAILQPLSLERIYKLTAVKDEHLNSKARTILEIIEGNSLKANDLVSDEQFNPFSTDTLEKIKHPVYSKKGKLSNFSKWISSYKIPDFSTMKDIAENFSPTKHKAIADIIADILHVFNIPNLEIFIVRGKQSVGVKVYEAQTPFLIIGSDHLDPKSPFYFTYNEMSFAIAQEIAFLYFKFARITSSDIWRGAMEKGNFVVDTLIDIIPFAGSISNVLKKATKLKQVSSFMQKNNKITSILTKGQQIDKIANKSQGVLKMTSDMLGTLSSKKTQKETQKQDEIIAISRMMQLTADRVGLLVCNDPVSAVRSVFLSSKNLVSQLPTIQKYGLNSFLLKKDENENFVNLNFAVRFASLFSFWLSDDFDNIRDIMISK